MKYSEILEKSEEVENTYIIIREPTKKHWGYAIRMMSDPMIEINKIEDDKNGAIVIDKKRYRRAYSFNFPISIIAKLNMALDDILNREI